MARVIEKMSDRVLSKKYQCIRCLYETTRKGDMKKHLYDKNKECPTTRNDIVITDEIREKILKDRKYHIPKLDKINIFKKACNEKIKEVTDECNKKIKMVISPFINKDIQIIYLIKPRANVFNRDNIFKFGHTIIKDKSVNISRILSYGNGSDVILVVECIDSLSLEKTIKNKFEKEFIRPYAEEHFIGNKDSMLKIIMLSVIEERENYNEEQRIFQEKLETFNKIEHINNNNIIVSERRGSF